MEDIDDILASEPPPADDRASHKAEVRKQFMTKLWFEALKSRTSAVEPAAARPEAREPPPPPPEEPTGDAKGEAERRLTRTCREPGAPPASEARAELAKLFRDEGVLCLHAAAPAGLAAECRAASAALLDEVLALVPARDAGDGSGVFTKELVLRSPGRYDLLHGVSARAAADAGGADDARGAPFRAIKAAAQGAWMPLVRTLLGAACYLIASGCVISRPGASEQSLHRDGKHLFDDDDERDHVLPPHCITVRPAESSLHCLVLYSRLPSKVFVPLVDLARDASNGPTQYYPGSQNTRADAPPAGAVAVDFGGAPAGSAILFDYRILHRGLRNDTDAPRPMLYYTYGRQWFRDSTNYSELSLFS